MKKKILVIEDDHEIRQTIVDVLSDEGYDVLSAENGLEGLKLLQETEIPPGLIIVDWMMPVMDGKVFRKEQLKMSKFACVPTILFSANGQISQSAIGVEYDDFVKKPIDLDQLFALAEKYC